MRIKALLLTLIMMFSAFVYTVPASYAQNAVNNVDDFQNRLTFLTQLGIGKKSELSSKDNILTRAEFVAIAVELMNTNYRAVPDDSFVDVPVDHPFASEIYTAKEYGLVSGTSVANFSPDRKITYGAAVKILTTVLGYEQYALVIGAYPVGYFTIAQRSGLLKGISGDVDSTLRADVAVMLIYNALHTEMALESAIYNGDVHYSTTKNKNLLTENFKLSSINGVIQTAGLYSMVPGYTDTNLIININSSEFKCDILKIESYLGLNACVWYTKDREAIAIDVDSSNKIMEIGSDDIIGFDNFELYTYEGDKTKSYRFDRGYSFVKNGRQIVNDNSDFKIPAGKLLIIDNNGDGRFDIVQSFAKEYFIVSSIVNTSYTVYDKNQNNVSFSFDNNSEKSGKIYVEDIESGLIKEADFDDIAVGMVLEVEVSEDGILTKAIATTKTVKGEVTEIGEDEIFIDGTSYKMNIYFKTNTDVKNAMVGNVGEFHIAPDGTLTYMKSQSTKESEYGFFLDCADVKNGLDFQTQIKLLTSIGEVKVYKLSEYITFDGKKKTKSNSDEIKSKLMYMGVPQYQPIRYAINENGEINLIDLAEDRTDEEDSIRLDRTYIGDDTMRKHITGVCPYFTGNMGAPYFWYTEHTTIFTAPVEVGKAIAAGNKITEEKEEGWFGVISMADLSPADTYDVDAYDYNVNFSPAVVVSYRNSGAGEAGLVTTAQPPSASNPSYIVESVTTAISVTGDVTKRIYMLGMDGYKSYIISGNHYDYISDPRIDRIPNPGDVIRFTIDKNGEIMYIARDVEFTRTGVIENNKPGFTVAINHKTDGVSDTLANVFNYVSGTVQIKNPSSYVIFADKYPLDGLIPNANTPTLLKFGSGNNVIVYDVATSKATRGTKDDILESTVTGSDASYIVARLNYFNSTTIFVYNNGKNPN